jgi:hypothetical protein
MTRDKKQSSDRNDEVTSVANDKQHVESAEERKQRRDRDYRGPGPQGGKGTPSQAEGERSDE